MLAFMCPQGHMAAVRYSSAQLVQLPLEVLHKRVLFARILESTYRLARVAPVQHTSASWAPSIMILMHRHPARLAPLVLMFQLGHRVAVKNLNVRSEQLMMTATQLLSAPPVAHRELMFHLAPWEVVQASCAPLAQLMMI